MPRQAAEQYKARREMYRNALQAIRDIADQDIKDCLREALTAFVRKQYRGISGALTTRMGHRFTCLGDDHKATDAVHVEHAVPLNLIHDRILGIKKDGSEDVEARRELKEEIAIENYVNLFMVSVLVTPEGHGKLKAKSMHDNWNWNVAMPDEGWQALTVKQWSYEDRPTWLKLIMGRYEVAGIKYQPLPDGGRDFWRLRKAARKKLA